MPWRLTAATAVDLAAGRSEGLVGRLNSEAFPADGAAGHRDRAALSIRAQQAQISDRTLPLAWPPCLGRAVAQVRFLVQRSAVQERFGLSEVCLYKLRHGRPSVHSATTSLGGDRDAWAMDDAEVFAPLLQGRGARALVERRDPGDTGRAEPRFGARPRGGENVTVLPSHRPRHRVVRHLEQDGWVGSVWRGWPPGKLVARHVGIYREECPFAAGARREQHQVCFVWPGRGQKTLHAGTPTVRRCVSSARRRFGGTASNLSRSPQAS